MQCFFVRIFYGVILWLCSTWVLAAMPATSDDYGGSPFERHRVLFISSYHASFPSFFQQFNGLRSALDNSRVQLDVEFLDAKRLPFEENYQSFFSLLSRKLARLPKYDVLVVGDDHALQEVVRRKETLFRDLPVVFLGVNNATAVDALDQNEFTGVVESLAIKDTLSLIKNLYPKREVVVINDASLTGSFIQKRFFRSAKALGVEYREVLLSKMRFAELPEVLQSLDSGTPILLLSALQDREQNTLEFYRSIALIREFSSGPVFHLWKHGLGSGVVGGRVLSNFSQGAAAGDMVAQILKGVAVRDIPAVEHFATEWLFDYRQLNYYGIDRWQLPSGSTVLFTPQDEPRLIPLRVGVMAVLGMMLAAMLYMVCWKRGKVLSLQRQQHAELERLVDERTLELSRSKQQVEDSLQDRELILDNSIVAIMLVANKRISWCNAYCEFMFGYPELELQKYSIKYLLQDESGFLPLLGSVEEQITQKGAFVEEVQFKRKTGEAFWGMVHAKSVSPDSLRQGVLFIVSDISKTKSVQFELERLNERLVYMSQTDELTRVANRRAINEVLLREHERLMRYGHSYSVILIDIDHFKRINDRFGHAVGDEVLVNIAKLLQAQIRSVDALGRWGGEEFMVVCPCTEREQADVLADDLRKKIHEQCWVGDCTVSASFGIYQPAKKDTIRRVLECVDAALYKSKETRNTVTVYQNTA